MTKGRRSRRNRRSRGNQASTTGSLAVENPEPTPTTTPSASLPNPEVVATTVADTSTTVIAVPDATALAAMQDGAANHTTAQQTTGTEDNDTTRDIFVFTGSTEPTWQEHKDTLEAAHRASVHVPSPLCIQLAFFCDGSIARYAGMYSLGGIVIAYKRHDITSVYEPAQHVAVGWKLGPTFSPEYTELVAILATLMLAIFEVQTIVRRLGTLATIERPLAASVIVHTDCLNALNKVLGKDKLRGPLET